MICEAILKIKSDAQVSVSGRDIDTCTITWHDGNPTNITKEQILTKQTELQTAEDTKPENVKKASGKQKLLDLGLTEAEVKALIGV